MIDFVFMQVIPSLIREEGMMALPLHRFLTGINRHCKHRRPLFPFILTTDNCAIHYLLNDLFVEMIHFTITDFPIYWVFNVE